MMYHRGTASDYDEWESLGNPGWSFKECLPYFKKSEGFKDPNLPTGHPHGPLTNRVRHPELETFDPAYHGTEGPWQVSFHHLYEVSKAFIEASQVEGVPFNKDFNGTSTLGVNRIQTFIQRDGVRSSASRAFLGGDVVPGGKNDGSLRHRGTVRVVFGADAKRILFQVRRGVKMAAGIEFVDHKNGKMVRGRMCLLCVCVYVCVCVCVFVCAVSFLFYFSLGIVACRTIFVFVGVHVFTYLCPLRAAVIAHLGEI